MGLVFSTFMDQNLKKQQEFMLNNARVQMERQILMQNEMRERQMALQIAWSREFLKYYASFFGLAAVGLSAGALKKRKPALFVPLIPLSFILVYQVDVAYGSLVHRIRGGAEDIMTAEADRLSLPHGSPSYESIEKTRRIKSHLPAVCEK